MQSTTNSKFLFLVAYLCTFYILFSAGNPHHGEDVYSPVIRFLKELRHARRVSDAGFGKAGAGASGILPIKDGESSASTNQNSDSIRVGVGSGGSDQGQGQKDGVLQLEQTLQQISAQLPTQAPYPIERVNTGLRTLLGGVNSLSLADILRGSFHFSRNDNVRSVANTVIDSIFGAKGQGTGTGAAESGAGAASANYN